MQKKSNVSCMRQQQLNWALNECLAKMLQILEVTLTKLILRMDEAATKKSDEKFREMQNQTNNNTIYLTTGSSKKQKFDLNTEQNEEESENAELYVHDRLILAHAIIDLLNTIEAGSKCSYRT